MNHVTEHLAAYLANDMDRIRKAEIEAHLAECTMCREEYESLLKLWAKLAAIPEEQPSGLMRPRFYAMLHAYEEGARHARSQEHGFIASINRALGRFWPAQPAVQAGLMMAVLIVALVAGIRIGTPPQEQSELAHLRSEVQNMGHLLTMSLLNQQSASERLSGVSWTSQIDKPDPQVVGALVRALKYDSNVNVRLAAVDALGRFLGDPKIRHEVMDALPTQTSPLVQIALVDLMVQEDMKQSEPILRKMMADPHVNKAVKQRIQESMKEFSS